MSNAKTVSKNTIYFVFLGLAAILIAMGLLFSPSISELVQGYSKILQHPSLTDFDGLKQAGHFGTSFFNAGMLLMVVLLVYKLTNTDIQGVQIAAAMMVLGFSFYGKNIVNIWFPVIGVLLSTRLRGKPLSSATALAWFSTALSPIFSVLAFGTAETLGVGTPAGYIVGALMGILGGVLVSFIAERLPSIHQGYTLFNAGFAAGIAGILINALQKALNVGHDRFPYEATEYVSGSNLILGLMFAILFCYLIAAGFFFGGLDEFRKMIWHRSKGGNYVEKFGLAACLINMGVLGLMSTAYVFVVNGQLNGCLFACIWTATGFATCGVTVRMHLPIMAGVFIAAFITGGISGAIVGNNFFTEAMTKASSRPMLLAAIFGCGMAPIIGDFGIFAGIFVGAVHSILVPNTGAFHGWMSLYNNGLSLSLIATFVHPIYSRIAIRREEVPVTNVSAR